jgi:2-polyprenyl-3-methyl-5-hydroxy-6-metoxy-1,4-benzoquinol methylase
MTNQELIEEVFCTKFENKTLADIFFRNEAERWVYSYMYDVTEKEHLERYHYTKAFTKNKKVLDIACGCGYGSYIIVNEGEAAEVFGVDLDNDSIRYANHRFSNEKIKRKVGDAQEFIEDCAYEIIVSFETIEHLPKYERFLQNMAITLKKDGYFFVSTPIVHKTSTECKNPFHVIEWSFEDFQTLVSKYFIIEEVFIQNVFFNPTKNKKTILDRIKQTKTSYTTKEPIMFEKYHIGIDLLNLKEGYQMLICRKK